jgi:hypothetical protein
MSEDSISTYEIVNLQIKALDSLLSSALAEPNLDEGFRQEMTKIQACLDDYLERSRQAEEQDASED